MEKQRNKTVCRLFKRLLVLFFAAITSSGISAFGQTFNSKVASSLFIEPVENQNLYTKSDIKFEVLLPYASASLLQIKNPDYPENVNFKTLKKSEYYEDEGGTKIELWLSFDKKGTYKIPPLSVLIKNRTYLIKFAPIEMDINPADLAPRVVLEFSNGVTVCSDEVEQSDTVFSVPVGEKLSFRVNLQYGLQLLQFDYELPKNSIFKEKERYEITEFNKRDEKFSRELMPVADFEWIVLSEEIMQIPTIKLVATSYKGYKTEVKFPEFTIDFVRTASSPKYVANKKSDIFDSAFDFTPLDNTAGKELLVTDEICTTIAELRIKERYSTFDYFKNKKSRVSTEDFFLFDSSNNEFPVILVFVFLILSCILLTLIIVFVKRSNAVMIVLYSVLFSVSLGLTALCLSKSYRLYGMCLGGTLQSVPEETSASKSEISGGNRVYISEKSGDWYYIEFGESAGWIKADRVVLIR